jgi:serine protease
MRSLAAVTVAVIAAYQCGAPAPSALMGETQAPISKLRERPMKLRSNIVLFVVIFVLLSFWSPVATAQSVDAAKDALKESADLSRAKYAGMSFEKFEEVTFREAFENGKYIVNGDVAIGDKKLLREFYERNVAAAPPVSDDTVPEFAVALVGGLQAVWGSSQKRALTYCVSNAFGSRYSQMVSEMQKASIAWDEAADIDFIHVMSEDDSCTADNSNVVFDVRPVSVNGQYLARAFFPNEPRQNRNVLVDESSFGLNPDQALQLVGILRHELGHTIGARHEHTRPEAGTCFEDDNWEPIGDYDPLSVMHYPQCNGMGDWSLTLTANDRNGAACLYGPASGFTIDPTICTNPAGPGLVVERIQNQSVGEGEENRYPDPQVSQTSVFPVIPNSVFDATMSGSGSEPGDPDLYVSFDGTPQVGLEFDCRPYLTGAEESCELDVPAGASIARVMVHGFTDGNYELTISYKKRE